MQNQEWMQDSSKARVGDNYQRQKIYPQRRWIWNGKSRGLIALILLAISAVLALMGLGLTVIMQAYVNAQGTQLTMALFGMLGLMVIILVCVAIFVIVAVALIMQALKARWYIRQRYARL
jgi:uncharacterized membrane protein